MIGFLALFFFTLPLFFIVRWRPLVNFLGGIASFYRVHHLIGLFCILPIIIHILSQFLDFGFSDWQLLFDFADSGLLSAWCGFTLIITGILFAYLKHLRYKVWKNLHFIFIPAYFLIFWHVWIFLPSETLFSFSILILIISGILVFSILLFTYFFPLHEINFEVNQLVDLGDGVFELYLIRSGKNKNLSYPAGQIIYIRFDSEPFSRNWHPFSIASCKIDHRLRLLIKSFGYDTKQLKSIKIGSMISVVGPFHEFSISPEINQIWIAGGVGISPFIAMVRCLGVKNYAEVKLFYFGNSIDEIKCKKELNEAMDKFSNFTWQSVIEPRGNTINEATLYKLIQSDKNSQYLVCGPPAFMKYIRMFLRKNGINKQCIKTEEYSKW